MTYFLLHGLYHEVIGLTFLTSYVIEIILFTNQSWIVPLKLTSLWFRLSHASIPKINGKELIGEMFDDIHAIMCWPTNIVQFVDFPHHQIQLDSLDIINIGTNGFMLL